MRKLKHFFAEVPIGTSCLGTIHCFNLPSRRLIERGIIRKATKRVDVSTETDVRQGRRREVEVGDYIFLGFDQ